MLVLGRKIGEQVSIGPDIQITVTKCYGRRCSLGIKAPPGVLVVRSELLKKDNSDKPTEGDDR